MTWRAQSSPPQGLVPHFVTNQKTALKQAEGWQPCNFSWGEPPAIFITKLPIQPDPTPFATESQEGKLVSRCLVCITMLTLLFSVWALAVSQSLRGVEKLAGSLCRG